MYSSRLINKLSQVTETGPLLQKIKCSSPVFHTFLQHVQQMETIIGKPVRIIVTTHKSESSSCFQMYRRSAEAVTAESLKSTVALNNTRYLLDSYCYHC